MASQLSQDDIQQELNGIVTYIDRLPEKEFTHNLRVVREKIRLLQERMQDWSELI